MASSALSSSLSLPRRSLILSPPPQSTSASFPQISFPTNKPNKNITLFSLKCSANDDQSKDLPIELKYPAFPTVMDINQIREILPHRFPFLLVDRVVEYNPGVSAVAIKNVTINDNFFPGHFPERPIMPGVLMVEGNEDLPTALYVSGDVSLPALSEEELREIEAAQVEVAQDESRASVMPDPPTQPASQVETVQIEVGVGPTDLPPLGSRAMAQVGGIVMLQPEVGGSRENFFFAGIDNCRFRKPVIAGDTLVMRMTLTKLQKRFGIAKMAGKAYVGGEVVCEGDFLMAMGS